MKKNETTQISIEASDAAAKLNQGLEIARNSAAFLCVDLRTVHSRLCKNKPSAVDKLAERHVLELLNLATEIKTKLKGLSE